MTRLTGLGIAAIVFSLLIGLMANRGMLARYDDPVMRAGAMVEGQTPVWAITAARSVTHLGDPVARTLIAIIAFALMVARRSAVSGGLYLLVVGLGVLAYTGLKQAYARPRPHLTTWLTGPVDPSFPSGHAGGAMLVLLLAAMLLGGRGLIPVAVGVALLIGLSRVAMGVHWPSDVVGGWLFGGGVAMIGYAMIRAVAPVAEIAKL